MHVEALPQANKYQRAERALRSCKTILGTDCPMVFNQSRAARMRHSLRFQAYCDVTNINNAISQECSKGQVSHECLNMFRQTPQLVRNFRLLWGSLPKPERFEKLIKLMQGTDDHVSTFRFLGVYVCQKAFQLLTGVSSKVLQNVRTAIQRKQVTMLSRAEAGKWLEIRNAPRAPRYLDPWHEQFIFFPKSLVCFIHFLSPVLTPMSVRMQDLGWKSMLNYMVNNHR